MISCNSKTLRWRKYVVLKTVLILLTTLVIGSLIILAALVIDDQTREVLKQWLPTDELKEDNQREYLIRVTIVVYVICFVTQLVQLYAIIFDNYWFVVVYAIIYGFILLIQLITANIGGFLIVLAINVALISYSDLIKWRHFEQSPKPVMV